ncbi:MAG: acetate--CoA ligase family protein [Candidatus Loosdrechtia sp.]|uniref:acetate--CoA ligase family protein n=1 Tax=Candidatus Loosdrechtia sp. TaxID=3101272 RepID=UPI003A6CD798|nr:MAG: acetate--CoA ligase family protein [Candidatus Jettenia sp. AMX2]
MNTSEAQDINLVRKIIDNSLQQRRKHLLEPEAMKVIKAFGIPCVRYALASSAPDAIQMAEQIGYPVVMKIVSPDIIHKTEVGGVKLSVNGSREVEIVYEEIIENARQTNPNAEICGVLIAEMAAPSLEIIIGGIRDLQFGPVVMFGLGGIFVEVLKDISFRIAPVGEHEVFDMIQDVRGAKILQGFRGKETLDIYSLVQTVRHVSDIMIKIEQINEIDLNPVRIYSSGVKTLDARIILE